MSRPVSVLMVLAGCVGGSFAASESAQQVTSAAIQRHIPQNMEPAPALIEVSSPSGGGEVDKDVAYDATTHLAGGLSDISDALITNVDTADTESKAALDDSLKLDETAFKFFGTKADPKGLKGLDRQAHQLRGHLQRKHQWMTDLLEGIVADFQNAQTSEQPGPPDEDGYDPEKPDKTGLEPHPIEEKEPTPWKFAEPTTEYLAKNGAGAAGGGGGD